MAPTTLAARGLLLRAGLCLCACLCSPRHVAAYPSRLGCDRTLEVGGERIMSKAPKESGVVLKISAIVGGGTYTDANTELPQEPRVLVGGDTYRYQPSDVIVVAIPPGAAPAVGRGQVRVTGGATFIEDAVKLSSNYRKPVVCGGQGFALQSFNQAYDIKLDVSKATGDVEIWLGHTADWGAGVLVTKKFRVRRAAGATATDKPTTTGNPAATTRVAASATTPPRPAATTPQAAATTQPCASTREICGGGATCVPGCPCPACLPPTTTARPTDPTNGGACTATLAGARARAAALKARIATLKAQVEATKVCSKTRARRSIA